VKKGALSADGNSVARRNDNVLPFPDLIGERRERFCEAAREQIEDLPEVRIDRIRRAQERIREGYYDRPEVREAILARLLADILGSSEGMR
jgi:hypothetical protein